MSSKRDLVEAHSFNRRRLVTAFLSGAPGGREVEPVRYGRTLIGGVVLAGMILAGAAVLGFMKPTAPSNWDQNGIVVDKDNGSRFIASGGVLSPVVNTASARLLMGPGKVKFVPDDMIAKRPHGVAVGIPGAPDVLPARDMLVNTGWTACTNREGGVNLSIRRHPGAAAASGRAIAVTTPGGTEYLIAGSRRYELPQDRKSRAVVLRALGFSQEPFRVPGQWVDMFAPGDSLGTLNVKNPGTLTPVGNAATDVGTPVTLGGNYYVLTGNKSKSQLKQLTPFAWKLYTNEPGIPTPRAGSTLPTIPPTAGGLAPGDWPKQVVHPLTGTASGNPCALLRSKAGGAPSATLAAPTDPQVEAPSQPGIAIQVQPGYGAVVRSYDAVPGKGLQWLIDSQGRRYALNTDGSSPDVVSNLGYGDLTPPPVPNAWLSLFTGAKADGPALSFDLARKTVM